MNIKQYRNRLKTVLELFQSCFIFHNSTTMSYSIKDLAKHWLNKNLIYDALKNSLPFSNKFIKNKRLFNETDLKLFLFYKTNGLEKTLLQYGTVNENNDDKTVFKTVLPDNKETINKPLLEDLETVKKQFIENENRLKLEIEQKEKIISIKEDQTQKYALLKMEEQKEKEGWIKKYEVINDEKNDWIKKFYSLKSYLLVFIILFVLSTTALVLKITNIY